MNCQHHVRAAVASLASPHPMILISVTLPTKCVDVTQYGGNVKAMSLLPFWINKHMKQVIHGEDFGPDLFQVNSTSKGSWSWAATKILSQELLYWFVVGRFH